MMLRAEDFERYQGKVLPPPKNDPASREQELVNKCREPTKLENQLMHYSGVIQDLENKLVRHWVILSDLEGQHREIRQEITTLRAEVAAKDVRENFTTKSPNLS